MRKLVPLLLLAAFLSAPLLSLRAATTAASPATGDRSPIGPWATTIATVTGIAISPLLGTGVYGAYLYFTAESAERASLPWFAQATFWLPALLIVGACAAKDAAGAVLPPGWKKPLDVLETVENKVSGLVAAGAVVPLTMATLSKMILGDGSAAAAGDILASSGLATIHLGAIDFSWLLNILTVPFGIAVFAVVWMASHAINALILLSPWGAIDAALKSARLAVLGLLTASATLDPWISAILSVVLIVFSYFIAGWSFRLTVFGSVFSWDFLTGRRRRFSPEDQGNLMFSSNLMSRRGAPMRTYGRLSRNAESSGWEFRYRPWLVGPERLIDLRPESPVVGQGMFVSSIRDGDKTLFVLPPRYRGHEEAVASLYQITGGVQPAGLLKSWGVLKELFGGGSARAQVA